MRWRAPAVILACGGVILGLALGTRQSFGLFLRPMSMDLGWGREAFSFAIALQNLVWGCAMPFMGAIADRYGAGRVLTAGGLAYGAGLLAMAHSTTPLAFNVAAGLLVGFGLACTGFGVVMAVVARAFPPEKRSLAVGIVGACGSFGQFAMLPGGQALISRLWLAHRACGPGSAFVSDSSARRRAGWPQCRRARERAVDRRGARRGDAAPRLLAAHRKLLRVRLPDHLRHDAPARLSRGPRDERERRDDRARGDRLLQHRGLGGRGRSAGATASGCSSPGSMSSARSRSASFIAAPLTAAGTYLFAAVLGLTWLGTVPLTNSLVGQIFGVKYLSTLFSIAFLGHQLGAFIGAWAGGAVFDPYELVPPVWTASIALSVLAAALCVPINERALRPA